MDHKSKIWWQLTVLAIPATAFISSVKSDYIANLRSNGLFEFIQRDLFLYLSTYWEHFVIISLWISWIAHFAFIASFSASKKGPRIRQMIQTHFETNLQPWMMLLFAILTRKQTIMSIYLIVFNIGLDVGKTSAPSHRLLNRCTIFFNMVYHMFRFKENFGVGLLQDESNLTFVLFDTLSRALLFTLGALLIKSMYNFKMSYQMAYKHIQEKIVHIQDLKSQLDDLKNRGESYIVKPLLILTSILLFIIIQMTLTPYYFDDDSWAFFSVKSSIYCCSFTLATILLVFYALSSSLLRQIAQQDIDIVLHQYAPAAAA